MAWLKPVTIRGIEYPSISDAARALKVSRKAVQRAMATDRLDRVGLKDRPNLNCMPVKVRGIVYPSQKDAALALGVSGNAVSQALKRGTIDKLGLKRGDPKCGWPAVPVKVGKIEFPSKAALSRFIGIDRSTLGKWERRGQTERIAIAVMRKMAEAENAARRAADKKFD